MADEVSKVADKVREIRESAGRTGHASQDGDHFSFSVPGANSPTPVVPFGVITSTAPATVTPHTPLPWAVYNHADGSGISWIEGDRDTVAESLYAKDAKFIVRACNNYEALLAVLKALLDSDAVRSVCDMGSSLGNYQSEKLRQLFADADAAIAKAESSQPDSTKRA